MTASGVEVSGVALAIVDGRASLAFAPRALATLASLERMEVSLPARRRDGAAAEPGHAPDGPITVERARRRRGRLNAAVITVDDAR